MTDVPPPPPPPPPYGTQPYGTPSYGTPAYGGPPSAGPPYAGTPYGQPGYGYTPPVRDHPKATTALVLGILGLVVCQLCAPFALIIGRNAVKEIDASAGRLGGRSQATAGWILGLIGTILIALFFGFILLAIVLGVVSSSS